MKRPTLIFAYSTLIVFITMLFFLGDILPSHDMRFSFNQSNLLNEGWQYAIDEGDYTALESLPTSVPLKANQVVTIERTLNDDFISSQTLLIRTSLSDLVVHLDGAVIYERSFEDKSVYASSWHLIELPENSDGKSLEIILSSPYSSISGVVNDLYYGAPNDLYLTMFNLYGLRLIVGIIALIIGLVIMISSAVLLRKENQNTVYLGLFIVLFSLWVMGESRLLQFFIKSSFIHGALSYLSLALFPVPLIIYLKREVIIKYKKLYHSMGYIFGLNFILVLLLHFTGFLSFFEWVPMTIALIIIVTFISIIVLIYEYRIYHHKTTMKGLIILIIIGAFSSLEALNFFFSDFRRTSDFAAIGFTIVFIMVFIGFIQFIIKTYKKSLKLSIYEQLAYTDALTKSRNRLAYFNDLKKLEKDLNKDALRMVFFDLDNLKVINDTFGHHEGDRAIITAYQLINETFGKKGNCYRMGGDEFSCIIHHATQEEFNKIIALFHEKMHQINASTAYNFRISLGFSQYQEAKDSTLEDTFQRADRAMYGDKHPSLKKQPKP